MKRNDILTPQIKEKIYEGFKGSAWKTIKNFMSTHGGDIPKINLKRKKQEVINNYTAKIHGEGSILDPNQNQYEYISDLSEKLIISNFHLKELKKLKKAGGEVDDQIEYHTNVVRFSKERLTDGINDIKVIKPRPDIDSRTTGVPAQQSLPGMDIDDIDLDL